MKTILSSFHFLISSRMGGRMYNRHVSSSSVPIAQELLPGASDRNYHVPVMLEQCCKYLDIQPGRVFIDCTLGGGGHTKEIMKRGGKVIGIDQDDDAIQHTSALLQDFIDNGQLDIIQTNFRDIATAVTSSKLWPSTGVGVDGALMDLGMSSYQIDEHGRGFSFGSNGPLDMRMNKKASDSFTAWHVVNEWDLTDLANVIYQFGGERKSRQIAREIVMARPLQTTLELARVIERITPVTQRQQTLARCFQGIRIAVNDEMNVLDAALESMHRIIRPGGRLVVLSYHSLEDRRVKLTLKKKDSFWEPVEKDIIMASDDEIAHNSRARSAKLRVGRRLQR